MSQESPGFSRGECQPILRSNHVAFNKEVKEIDAGIISAEVKVIVDRPLGCTHPEHPDMIYSVNYGYIEGVMAADGEEQDAYLLGIDVPVKEFVGKVIAVIHRRDDIEDKWVVAPDNISFSPEEIMKQVSFAEQYFDSEIIM